MKKLFILLFFCSLLNDVNAQSPSYATAYGTSGGNVFPFSQAAGGNQRVQWLYLAGDFNQPTSAPSGLITDVYIHFANNSSSMTCDLEISMGHTSLTTFSGQTSFIGGQTVVFSSSSVTVTTNASGWAKFTLQTPFSFDNSQPLLMQARTNTNTGFSVPQRGTGGRIWGTYAGAYVNQGLNQVDFGFDLQTCSTPNVTSHPQGVSKCSGDNASFSVATSPLSTSSWQWQVNNGSGWTNLSNGGNYSGVTTTTLSVSSIPQSFNAYSYRCLMYGTCTTAIYSNPAMINLVDIAKIVSQSVSASVCENAPITLGVLAQGGGLSYQWQISQGTGWADVLNIPPFSGSNTDTLTIAYAPDSLNGRKFRTQLSTISTCSSPPFSSNDIPVAVASSPASNPANQTVSEGTSAIFSISTTGSLLYQWQEDKRSGSGFKDLSDNSVYSGVNTAILKINDVPLSYNNYQYRCMISGMCDGIVFSDASTLNVNKATAISAVQNRNDIVIYPNPAHDKLFVKAPPSSMATITAIDGRILLDAKIVKEGLDISKLVPGIYVIRIMSENGIVLAVDKISITDK